MSLYHAIQKFVTALSIFFFYFLFTVNENRVSSNTTTLILVVWRAKKKYRTAVLSTIITLCFYYHTFMAISVFGCLENLKTSSSTKIMHLFALCHHDRQRYDIQCRGCYYKSGCLSQLSNIDRLVHHERTIHVYYIKFTSNSRARIQNGGIDLVLYARWYIY